MNITVHTATDTIRCTWAQFRADNADGFAPDELEYIGILLQMDGEADLSQYMHMGADCRITVERGAS